MDRRILAHKNGHTAKTLPADCNHLDRCAQCAQEQRWRITEQPDIETADIECLGDRRPCRELLPLKGIRQIVKYPRRLHHGLGVVTLVTHHQRLRVRSKTQPCSGHPGRQFRQVTHVRLQMPSQAIQVDPRARSRYYL
ncbi:hypothetical protein D3C84_875950 [compost metagenome]